MSGEDGGGEDMEDDSDDHILGILGTQFYFPQFYFPIFDYFDPPWSSIVLWKTFCHHRHRLSLFVLLILESILGPFFTTPLE